MENNTNKQLRASGKAFYLLLCGLMGALLFVVIERSLALISYLLLSVHPNWSFGMSYVTLQAINILLLVVAVFFGLWYGIWLGLHWYGWVYEQRRGKLTSAHTEQAKAAP